MALQNLTTGLAQDDSVNSTEALLRRILKALESSGMVDGQTRQRVTLDAISAALTLATVTTVGTVTTVTGVTTVTTLTNLSQIAGDSRPLLDLSRIAYNTGIRAKLN
jgi:hypothetical protein